MTPKDLAFIILFGMFLILFTVKTNELIKAIDKLTVNYSSHNDITTQVVNFPPGQLKYDIAHGGPAFKEEVK